VARHALPHRERALVALALEVDAQGGGGHRVFVVTAAGALIILGGSGEARVSLARVHGAPSGAALLRYAAGGTHLLVRSARSCALCALSFLI
jgi:hypothetical protein